MNIGNDIYFTNDEMLECSEVSLQNIQHPNPESCDTAFRELTFKNFQKLILREAYATIGPTSVLIRIDGMPAFRATLADRGYFKSYNDEPSLIEIYKTNRTMQVYLEGPFLHRITGPAYMEVDPNDGEWWIRGVHMETREDFINALRTEEERIDGLRALIEYTEI